MNNLSASLKALAIYAVCLPLAIFIGYIISNPLRMSTVVTYAILAMALALPLLLRWHHALLMLSWNLTVTIFFIPGQPTLMMLAVLFSLSVFILQRALDRNQRFQIVHAVTWPLVFLTAVVLVTAKLTGGIGFRSLGGEVYGGRHYMYLLFGILGYFVLSIRPIPLEKANLYMGLFCIGGVTSIIGDMHTLLPSGMDFIFWFIPPHPTSYFGVLELGKTRLGGAPTFSTAIFLFMLARYGITGVFSGKFWRAILFVSGCGVGLLGGYRGFVATIGVMFVIQFLLEGLHKTKWLVRFAFLGVIACTAMLPFTNKLPFTLQRAISFLPVELDPEAIASGEATAQWRYDMWSGLLPQIPKHLLLGKGYAFSADDYRMSVGTEIGVSAFREFDPSQGGLALAGDFHNGWISVILPFGIWGLIAVLWFFWAAIWVLIRNFRYGDPELKRINTVLLAYFLARLLMFWGGSLNIDMLTFGALVGLSVSFNHGVSRPAPASAPQLATIPPRRELFPRPAFGRSI